MSDDPGKVLNQSDPGDDTQLRFRYQHGYGVILLAGAATGQLPYVAIWCEHHDDLLGEKFNGRYDSYQIKTGTPENGPWKMVSDQFVRSIAKFIEQDDRFPDKFDAHNFVSNVECYDTGQQDELQKSPVKCIEKFKSCPTCDGIAEPYATAIKKLAKDIGTTVEKVLRSCHLVQLITGPPTTAFESEIAHLHLPKLDGCAAMAAVELDELRDELIQRVFNSSSLSIPDPSKHWSCVLGADEANPRLKAKRLIITETIEQAISGKRMAFRFAPATTELKLQPSRKELDVLAKKLVKGGLASQLDIMQWRTVSAERHFLSLIAQGEDEAAKVINQVRGIVKGTCADALVAISEKPYPKGAEIFRLVSERLQKLTNDNQDQVCNQTYDCLMGMAGLLAEECEVWWSAPFDPKEQI